MSMFIIKKNLIFCSEAPSPNPTLSIWGKKFISSRMVFNYILHRYKCHIHDIMQICSKGDCKQRARGCLSKQTARARCHRKKRLLPEPSFWLHNVFLVAEERIGGETDRWTRRLSTVGNHYFKAQTAISQSMAPCK